MRRARQKGIVSCPTTSAAPAASNARRRVIAELDFREASAASLDSEEIIGSSDGPLRADGAMEANHRAERHRGLQVAIRQRIESRLPGRVRNLAVRIFADTVLLEGQCATYYTKQLAQHAAMGVLEEGEHLENAIVVNVPR